MMGTRKRNSHRRVVEKSIFEFRINLLSDATGGVPLPRHGAEAYAFPKEKHRFLGHALMGSRFTCTPLSLEVTPLRYGNHFSQRRDGRRSSFAPPSSQGPETHAFPKEKQRFPGHAMMRTWKRNTDRRIVEKNVSGIGITFVNKSIPSATLRNSGKTQSVGHLA